MKSDATGRVDDAPTGVFAQGMSLEDKAALTAGTDMWTTAAVPAHGIPAVRMTDGPAGARGPNRSPSVALPSGIALGATWDRQLMVEVGEVLGHQSRTKGARVVLAPTVNLHRSPLGGRTFESFSEDPLLTGQLAAALIRGVQSQGVAATVKHFVANEAETDRFVSNSVVDERTLRELYLLPFEIAVKDGRVQALMTGYNRVNGVWCGEHRELLSILREEWGFEGFVVSDWYAVGSTVDSILAGLDIEMPGPARTFGSHLADAVRDGRVSEETIDAAVSRLLSVFERIGALDDDAPGEEVSVDLPDHRAIARRAAQGSMVLLRNESVLPFDVDSLRTIAVVGPNADQAQIMGGGSATLEPHYRVSPLEAIRRRLGDRVEVTHEPGCDTTVTLPSLDIDLDEAFFDSDGNEVLRRKASTTRFLYFGPPSEELGDRWSMTATGVFTPTDDGVYEIGLVQSGRGRVLIDGEVVVDGVANPPPPSTRILGFGSDQIIGRVALKAGVSVEIKVDLSNESAPILVGAVVGVRRKPADDLLSRAIDAATKADAVVVVVGTNDDWESEGYDRTSLNLPGDQDELVRRICAANPNTAVVLNAGSPLDLPWAEDAPALLEIWFGGQEMSDALVDVLTGEADPGGRLPSTFPLRIEHTPAFGNFPGENGEVRYGEGLLMGYRWYDSRQLEVAFPFGHGLSYTEFEIGLPSMTIGQTVVVETEVTNIGDRRGVEVIQLYVEPVDPDVMRPRKELKGFEKVELGPGESTVVEFVLDVRAFAYWQPDGTDYGAAKERQASMQISAAPDEPEELKPTGWTVDPGKYRVHLGRSISDISHTVEVTL
ncbi:MAG TPA: glycoside hydrolase family 3 C-terminal domain-containing protein [Acidimicrobiia bacterium]